MFFPGVQPSARPCFLNGIRFDIIGVLAKVGKDGNNGTNARIFVPVETMRSLFPLKEENSESALSFINYRPLIKAEHMASKEESPPDHCPPSRIRSQTGRCL